MIHAPPNLVIMAESVPMLDLETSSVTVWELDIKDQHVTKVTPCTLQYCLKTGLHMRFEM